MALQENEKEKMIDHFFLADAEGKKKLNIYYIGFVMSLAGLVLTGISLFVPAFKYTTVTTLVSGNDSSVVNTLSFIQGSYVGIAVIAACIVAFYFSVRKQPLKYFFTSFAVMLLAVVTMIFTKFYISRQVTEAVVGTGYESKAENVNIAYGFILMIVALLLVIVSAFMQKTGDDRIKKIEEEKLKKRREELEKRREELKKKKESSVVFK